jgi:hypothetical protein
MRDSWIAVSQTFELFNLTEANHLFEYNWMDQYLNLIFELFCLLRYWLASITNARQTFFTFIVLLAHLALLLSLIALLASLACWCMYMCTHECKCCELELVTCFSCILGVTCAPCVILVFLVLSPDASDHKPSVLLRYFRCVRVQVTNQIVAFKWQ